MKKRDLKAELRNSLNILKRDREATGYKEPDNG